jgi:hypothetical protein
LNAVRAIPAFLFDADDAPSPPIDLQAEIDELTRVIVTAVVTSNDAMIEEFWGVRLRPIIVDAQRLFGGRLPTPVQLLALHDVVMATLTAGMRESGRAREDHNMHLIRELIAATVPLADAARACAPQLNVRLAPNAIDPMDFQHAKRNDGIVRIGYGSHWTHKPDTALIMPALRECAKMPNVEVWFFGWHPAWSHDLVVERTKVIEFDGLVYHHGATFSDARDFFRALSILDVALAPLRPSLLNRCRGSAKWFESAMYRIPMVVSDMPPFACVEHGVTGFKARTEAEFTEYAVQLCKDAMLRKRIGGAAHDAVMANHTITACAEQWRRAVVA